MSKIKIQRIDENNKIIGEYNSIMDAAAAIDTKFEPWKVALTIAWAITHNKRAYKSIWKEVKNN